MTARLWRIAGTLAIAHVVLTFAGISLETTPELGATANTFADSFVHSSLTRTLTGGVIEYLAFLVFLAGILLIAQLLRGDGDLAWWLTSLVRGAGVTYTAVTLATGFPAGAAALYDGHRGGTSLATLTAINDIRNFAFFLSIGTLGLCTLALSGAIRLSGRLPSWLAYTGFAVGCVCIAAVPAQPYGAVNYAILLWLVWFVALGVTAIRGAPGRTAPVQAAIPAQV